MVSLHGGGDSRLLGRYRDEAHASHAAGHNAHTDQGEAPVTAIRFSGGEVIEVNLSLEEVRDLLQKALAGGVLLELESEDGDALVINPHQVQYLQNGSGEPFPRAETPPAVTAVS
jgi:hypothetical protein